MMRRVALALLLLAGSALPARADSITIDSSNCSSPRACFGLAWTLTINTGSFGGGLYTYQALLDVTDDSLVVGTPSVVISAVDFKVSSSISGATLYTSPVSSSGWTTAINVLNSGGCTGPNAGFVCSQSPTDPANFIASSMAQTWGWYFNTSDPIFTGLIGGHIGAKLVDLETPGRLLSQQYQSAPEPSTLALLMSGTLGLLATRRRKPKAR